MQMTENPPTFSPSLSPLVSLSLSLSSSHSELDTPLNSTYVIGLSFKHSAVEGSGGGGAEEGNRVVEVHSKDGMTAQREFTRHERRCHDGRPNVG